MAAVELESVSKVFAGDVHAVRDVSLSIEDGEFLVLVGPSGCGKSTLLRMIAGLEEPASGTIRIGTRDVTRVVPKDRDVAMVFQNYALYPHMSVRRNMAFGLTMRRRPKSEIEERVRAAADMLGLEELLDRKPGALSGGQRQRVAVGRAIVRDPAVFLFDEPLSNLDTLLRVEMRNELAALHRRLAATMVYVTHDQVEAMTLGDRIVVLRDGVVQQVGPPLDVYDVPVNTFVAAFLGSPPINLLPARLLQRATNEVRTCGLRPEHLRLAPITGEVSRAEARPGTMEGVVAALRPLGNETLVEVEIDGQTVVVRGGGRVAVVVGDAVSLEFDAARVHDFDRDGQRVSTSPVDPTPTKAE